MVFSSCGDASVEMVFSSCDDASVVMVFSVVIMFSGVIMPQL